jgi:hypothetical protein
MTRRLLNDDIASNLGRNGKRDRCSYLSRLELLHTGRLDVSSARTRETELRGSVPERAFDAAILVDGSSRR